MKFTKMHGAGNDYIYVDCTQSVIDNPSQVAIDLSDRHFGIGSDGLILIKNSDKADFFMEMYNADGSQGQMCGNGIRCVGKFVYDNGLTDKTTVTIDTLAGVKILELKTGADGKVETARVNMGAPILEAAQIPVDTKELKEYKGCEIETIAGKVVKTPVVDETIVVEGKEYKVTAVSMGMKFTKMHGAGNDYIYVDCTQSVIDNPSQVAIDLSDRHFGIGSDGLILIKNSDKADFFMEMYNADGSQGQMCGNGIRCVGKFVYDNGLTDKTTVTIDTLAGVKILELKTGADGKVETARVNMGAPILEAAQIPVDTKELKEYKGCEIETIAGKVVKTPVVDETIVVEGKEYKVTAVSMGNPHAIVYLDKDIDIKKFEIEKIGPFFENHKAFPERINTEFIQVVDKNNLNMRVWERGSGETLACGTGACASLVATVLNGMCDTTATLHLLGGDLKITWDKDENTVYLEGPAKTVFTGEVDI